MKIVSLIGARPNFMKIAPFTRAIANHNNTSENKIEHVLVHTGQHYDIRMSQKFFDDLNIPPPDVHLEIGSGSHAEQVGNTMIAFEKVLRSEKPDWVVVVGDINAILAGSVTAKKEHINLAHIEAGLRSGDITMPEEVNRLVADRLSDLLFTPDTISNINLRKEGVPEEKIKFVGNIMIDTLEFEKEKAFNLDIDTIFKDNLLEPQSYEGFSKKKFAVVTLHRPSNVDKKEIFTPIVDFLLNEVSDDMPIIWPVHPRAQNLLKEFGLYEKLINHKNIILLHPIGYHELLQLNKNARLVLTDSGGLQEECTLLGTPCLTLRWNTERPITLTENGGNSVLVGNNIDRIREEYKATLTKKTKAVRPELWDGETAERIVQIILETNLK